MYNEQEPTTHDILVAINEFSNKIEERFNTVEERFNTVEERFSTVGERLNEIDGRLDNINGRFNELVTKDYLDNKLADLRGDLVVLTRKEDSKLRLLVEKLHQRHILSDEDKLEILKMEPFPQLFV